MLSIEGFKRNDAFELGFGPHMNRWNLTDTKGQT